jgi:hypothetical protein
MFVLCCESNSTHPSMLSFVIYLCLDGYILLKFCQIFTLTHNNDSNKHYENTSVASISATTTSICSFVTLGMHMI